MRQTGNSFINLLLPIILDGLSLASPMPEKRIHTVQDMVSFSPVISPLIGC